MRSPAAAPAADTGDAHDDGGVASRRDLYRSRSASTSGPRRRPSDAADAAGDGVAEPRPHVGDDAVGDETYMGLRDPPQPGDTSDRRTGVGSRKPWSAHARAGAAGASDTTCAARADRPRTRVATRGRGTGSRRRRGRGTGPRRRRGRGTGPRDVRDAAAAANRVATRPRPRRGAAPRAAWAETPRGCADRVEELLVLERRGVGDGAGRVRWRRARRARARRRGGRGRRVPRRRARQRKRRGPPGRRVVEERGDGRERVGVGPLRRVRRARRRLACADT